MASDLTRALDALFHAAGDVRTAAADMRPITPAEFQQQRDLLALAARIRTDVARIGNECHDAFKSSKLPDCDPLIEAGSKSAIIADLAEAA